MEERERSEQIGLATSGDRQALQRLIVEYHAPLRRSIEANLNGVFYTRIDPDDVLQDTYVAAFKAIAGASFDGPAAFYGWLETIASNQLKSRIRSLKQKKRDIEREVAPKVSLATTHIDVFQRLVSPQSTPSRGVARAELAAAVMSCLARLTEEQRIAITMRFLEECSVSEIAVHLAKSESAVYMLFHRGLKALREYMDFITRYTNSS